MRIKIESIQPDFTRSENKLFRTESLQFPMTFSCQECAGPSWIRVVLAAERRGIDPAKLCKALNGLSTEAIPCLDTVSEFSICEANEPPGPCAKHLTARGEFAFRGVLARYHVSGQSASVQCGSFALSVPGSVFAAGEPEIGTPVKLVSRDFGFTVVVGSQKQPEPGRTEVNLSPFGQL